MSAESDQSASKKTNYRSSSMTPTTKPTAQQGSQTAPAPQQGQTDKPGQQQSGAPVIRDWAAI